MKNKVLSTPPKTGGVLMEFPIIWSWDERAKAEAQSGEE